jgi:hypothetical protein
MIWSTYNEFVFFLKLSEPARKRYPLTMKRRRAWGDIDRTRLMRAVRDTLAGKRVDPVSLIQHRQTKEVANAR